MESEFNIAIEITQELLPHLFLLLKLPEEESPQLKALECSLLRLFSDFLQEFLESQLGILPELNAVRQAFVLWASLQSTEETDRNRLEEAIHSLSSGGHLALFIRERNAGLLISVPTLAPHSQQTGGTATISTIAASLATPVVMSSVAAPTVVYPTTSVRLDFTRLLQSHFILELFSLMDRTTQDVAEVILSNYSKPIWRMSIFKP